MRIYKVAKRKAETLADFSINKITSLTPCGEEYPSGQLCTPTIVHSTLMQMQMQRAEYSAKERVPVANGSLAGTAATVPDRVLDFLIW
ncbi:hypothetical protein WAI453_001873 [Rhynchosporium graminicola]